MKFWPQEYRAVGRWSSISASGEPIWPDVGLYLTPRETERRVADRLLIAAGADPSLRDHATDTSPAAWADFFERWEVFSLFDRG